MHILWLISGFEEHVLQIAAGSCASLFLGVCGLAVGGVGARVLSESIADHILTVYSICADYIIKTL